MSRIRNGEKQYADRDTTVTVTPPTKDRGQGTTTALKPAPTSHLWSRGAVGGEQVTQLEIPFRRVHEHEQWRGRWLRGIELNEERLDAQGQRAQSCQREDTDPHREPSTALLEAWKPVEVELRQAVDGPTFRIWLAQLHPHSLIGGTWRLACRPEHVGWLRDRFGRVIEGRAGRPVELVGCGGWA